MALVGFHKRELYVEKKKKYTDMIKTEREKEREEKIQELRDAISGGDWGKAWQQISSALGKKANTLNYITKIEPNNWVEYFDSLYNIERPWNAELKENPTETKVEQLDKCITRTEIIEALREMKGKSAPGPDGVSTMFFKANKKHFIEILFTLFNKIMNSERFPEKWASALVVPLWKGKGSKMDVNNYRGIALQQCVGKVFVKIITKRLKTWCNKEEVLTEFQAGFRSEYSTVDQMFTLNHIITERKIKGLKTYCTFVDFSKAFDSINREALLYKLAQIGISSKIIGIVKNMFEKSTFSVKIGTKQTDKLKSKTGVAQGSQISPLLFILFINDMVKHFEEVERAYAPAVMGMLKLKLKLFRACPPF